jgi:hypothetical protein
MSYDSIATLPDFSGWWLQEFAPQDESPFGGPPSDFLYTAPFIPPIAAQIKALLDKATTAFNDPKKGGALLGGDYDAAGYCKPPQFHGFNGEDFNNSFEILFTPGRVTIADENNLVRRIELGGKLPKKVEVSNAGVSVGHWDGKTLVVETKRLEGPGPQSWGAIDVVERMTLAEPDVLQVDVVVTAPAVFTKPFARKLVYRRHRDHLFNEETPCVAYDRFGDAKTGKQRFDLTPPADLPPPPKD